MLRLKILLMLCIFITWQCSKIEDIRLNKGNKTMSSIWVDKLERTYLLYLPVAYDELTNIPLVIFMHGGGGSALQADSAYQFTAKANKEQFAIVYPEGVRSEGILGARTWNGGSCCAYAALNNINDVLFISTLIDTLIKKHPHLDSTRVYATGMSNGAIMSYRLACEIPHKIAAIAPVAGTLSYMRCNPSGTVPILHIHSILDESVPLNGGTGIFGFYFPPVQDGLDKWIRFNACNPTAAINYDKNNLIYTLYNQCEKSTIEYYITKDGGHSWPGGIKSRGGGDEVSTAINATDLIWEFFKHYKLLK